MSYVIISDFGGKINWENIRFYWLIDVKDAE